MSTGGTMARVYSALKARVLAGEFAPGERLDPARLSSDFGASVTPIRDALHRLSGERLVESWLHEGFRQPLVAEAALRDLYAWSRDVLRIVLRATERGQSFEFTPLSTEIDGYADSVARLFCEVGARSDNFEYRVAIASLNDRLHLARRIEARVIADPFADLVALVEGLQAGNAVAARRSLERFHRMRLRNVPGIAAALRARDEF